MEVDLLDCAMTVLHLVRYDDAMPSCAKVRARRLLPSRRQALKNNVGALQQLILLNRARKLRTRACCAALIDSEAAVNLRGQSGSRESAISFLWEGVPLA